MHVWVEILQMLLEIGYKLLRKYSEASAADFRKRVSAGGAGVLIDQLNPGAAASGAQEHATCESQRGARSMDEQR